MRSVPKEVDLGKDPVGRLLFTLAAPAITSQVVNALYNVVDRMYIGHIPGEGAAALTGLGVCFPLIMLISAFANLIGMGGAPRASIMMGHGDEKAAERILGNCFATLVALAVALTAFSFAFMRPMLMLFGASEATIGYAVDYMEIYAAGTIFVQLTLGMNVFITAQGFSKISMMTVVIGAAINIILDPIFIFIFDMGVRGAAWATVISQAVSAVWAVRFLCGGRTVLKLRRANMKISRAVLTPCVALGLAPFIMQSTESLLVLSFNSSLLKYGGDLAVGAMTIASSVMQFAMLPVQGLTQGSQPIVSYNYGAGKPGAYEAGVRHAFEVVPRMHCGAVGALDVLSRPLRPYFHRRPRAHGDGALGSAHIHGGHGGLRRADRLPADLHRAREFTDVFVSGDAAQDNTAHPAHLHTAAPLRRQGVRRILRGTSRRHHSGGDDGHALQPRVPPPAALDARRKRPASLTLRTRAVINNPGREGGALLA